MAKETEKTEEKVDEIPVEVMEAQTKFDDMIDSDDDSAIEEIEKNTSDETDPEEKNAEEETAETKPTGEKEAVEQTAEEKKIQAETDALEQEIIADEQKVGKPVEAEKEVVATDEAFDCGLDPEEYDEGLIKTVNALGQKLTDEAKALKSENAGLKSVIDRQEETRHAEWLDRKINSLGMDFAEALGIGDIEDIEPATVQFENRIALNRRILLIAQTYSKLGKPVPPRNKLFDSAVSYLFNKEKNKSKIETETKTKLAARADQAIGSGSSKSSALSAMARAVQIQKDFDAKVDEG